jgi:hypothetical protein
MQACCAWIAVVLAFLSCSPAPDRALTNRESAPAAVPAVPAQAATPASAAPSPAALIGDYVGAGCPAGRAGDCLKTTAQDRLGIRRSGDAFEAEVRLVFQGQTCYVKAPASWDATQFVVRADGLEVDKPCELRVAPLGAELALTDVDNRCRQVYCGSRGSFSGARFKKR